MEALQDHHVEGSQRDFGGYGGYGGFGFHVEALHESSCASSSLSTCVRKKKRSVRTRFGVVNLNCRQAWGEARGACKPAPRCGCGGVGTGRQHPGRGKLPAREA